MKIAHVVTLVSPDGAFGGPVRVAVNLSRAMREAGHEVVVLSAYQGYESPPAELDGVPARLFPARRVLPLGFSGLVAPGLLTYLRRHVTEFDVVHIHLARDLITLPAALIAGRRRTPYVTQTHGMVDASKRWLAHLLDAVATRRVLRRAATAFHLTDQERTDLALVARSSSLPLARLANGVPSSELTADVEGGREVLFLARLQARKRPGAFVEAALALCEQFPGTRFTLVGPDEGEAAAVLARIAGAHAAGVISWEGPIEPKQTLLRMSRSSVYVLPSVDEPFPMTVLEAMSLGMPCIVTQTCGLVGDLRDSASLRVVDHSVESLTEAIGQLLVDREARVTLGERARLEAQANFSMSHIAAAALSAYAQATSLPQEQTLDR